MLPVLVMMLALSRFLTATMIPSRQAGDVLSGIRRLNQHNPTATPRSARPLHEYVQVA
jgi:hypothetical protein